MIRALNECQRRYDAARGDHADTTVQAISTDTVRQCLAEVGMQEGLDATATRLFYGPDGRLGYRDGDDAGGIDTHGGFIFEDPREGGIYTVSCTSRFGPVADQSAQLYDTGIGQQEQTGIRAWIKSRVPRQDNAPHIKAFSSNSPRWSLTHGHLGYKVEPRFYEDVDSFDLSPLPSYAHRAPAGGLISLYPLEDKSKVSRHTGEVHFDNVEQALALTHELPAAMAAHGVMCEPRVLLVEAIDWPLLPREARLQASRAARQRRQSKDTAADEDDSNTYVAGAFLGAARGSALDDEGHRIRQSVSHLLDDQHMANCLAEVCSRLSMHQEKMLALQKRMSDPYLPQIRHDDLQPHLNQMINERDYDLDYLECHVRELAGLVLSLVEERPGLIRRAFSHGRKNC